MMSDTKMPDHMKDVHKVLERGQKLLKDMEEKYSDVLIPDVIYPHPETAKRLAIKVALNPAYMPVAKAKQECEQIVNELMGGNDAEIRAIKAKAKEDMDELKQNSISKAMSVKLRKKAQIDLLERFKALYFGTAMCSEDVFDQLRKELDDE